MPSLILLAVTMVFFSDDTYQDKIAQDNVLNQVVARGLAAVGPMCWAEKDVAQCIDLIEIMYYHGLMETDGATLNKMCRGDDKDTMVLGCAMWDPKQPGQPPVILLNEDIPAEWQATVATHELLHIFLKCLNLDPGHCGHHFDGIATAADRRECRG